MICQTDNAAGEVYPILPRCRKSYVKQQIQYELTCFSPFLETRCYTSLTILGGTVNCRFRFANCPLIHCGKVTYKFMALATSLVVFFCCCATANILTKLLQQCFLFFIVVVIPGQ